MFHHEIMAYHPSCQQHDLEEASAEAPMYRRISCWKTCTSPTRPESMAAVPQTDSHYYLLLYVLKCFKYMNTTIRNHPWKHLNAFATSKWTKPHGGSCFREDPVVVSKLFEIAQYRQPLNRYLRSPMTSVFCQILVGFINKSLNHFICVQRFQFLHPAFM